MRAFFCIQATPCPFVSDSGYELFHNVGSVVVATHERASEIELDTEHWREIELWRVPVEIRPEGVERPVETVAVEEVAIEGEAIDNAPAETSATEEGQG